MGEQEFSADSAHDNLNKIESQEQETINNGVYMALANIPKEALVNEDAMAEAFGVCNRTIRRMVARYELPPSIRIAGRSMWIVGNVTAWLKDMAATAENEARKNIERIRQHNA